MRVPDQVRECVVFIGERTAKRDEFFGTAFFVSEPWESKPEAVHFYLVTAAHVLHDSHVASRPFIVRLNKPDGSSTALEMAVNTDWKFDDQSDLAICRVEGVGDLFLIKRIPHRMFLTDVSPNQHDATTVIATNPETTLVSYSIGPGDEVFVVGLFPFLAGKDANVPIIRMGNIAMIPTTGDKVPTTSGPVDAYLVDTRSVVGMSGAPVFCHETNYLWFNKRKRSFGGLGPYHFLGIVHGDWKINERVIRQKPGKQSEVFPELYATVNQGLIVVTPAKKLHDLLTRPDVREDRMKAEKEGQPDQRSVIQPLKAVSGPETKHRHRDIKITPIGRKQFFADLAKATTRDKKPNP